MFGWNIKLFITQNTELKKKVEGVTELGEDEVNFETNYNTCAV